MGAEYFGVPGPPGPGGTSAAGDLILLADSAAGGGGAIVFQTRANVERGRITNGGIVQFLAPSTGNVQFQLGDVGGVNMWVTFAQGRIRFMDPRGGVNQPEFSWEGAQQRSDGTFAGWIAGIDAAEPVNSPQSYGPGRSFAIAKRNFPAVGQVFDALYITDRDTNRPGLLFGNSSVRQDRALVTFTGPSDGAGNALEAGLGTVLLSVPIGQTAYALAIKSWQSATNRLEVMPDGTVNVYDAGGGGQFSIGGTTGFVSIGASAFGQASNQLRIKPTNANATMLIATTAGGALLAQALNASSEVDLWTTNASALKIGTAGAAVLTLSGTGGMGFFGGAAIAKPAVAGSRAGNAALAALLTALANLGLVTDTTTA